MTQAMTTDAKGTKGFILYSPFTKNFFFRVYDDKDKKIFKDYKMAFEDMEVEILDNHVVLVDDGEQSRIAYKRSVLGRSPTISKQ